MTARTEPEPSDIPPERPAYWDTWSGAEKDFWVELTRLERAYNEAGDVLLALLTTREQRDAYNQVDSRLADTWCLRLALTVARITRLLPQHAELIDRMTNGSGFDWMGVERDD